MNNPTPVPRSGARKRSHSARADLPPAVLLYGEDAAGYDRIYAEVTAAVDPSDILEEFWVRDVVDLVWDALRLRALRAQLLRSATALGLTEVLKPLVGHHEVKALVDKWSAREPTAVEEVDAHLAKAGLTMDAATAYTLLHKLDDVERIDRLIASAEARRHLVIREIDRHRSSVAARLRSAVEEIEDATFSEVIDEDNRGSREA